MKATPKDFPALLADTLQIAGPLDSLLRIEPTYCECP
jgi:hypothetical protein